MVSSKECTFTTLADVFRKDLILFERMSHTIFKHLKFLVLKKKHLFGKQDVTTKDLKLSVQIGSKIMIVIENGVYKTQYKYFTDKNR